MPKITLKERLDCANPKDRDRCISELIRNYFTDYELKKKINKNSQDYPGIGRGYTDDL